MAVKKKTKKKTKKRSRPSAAIPPPIKESITKPPAVVPYPRAGPKIKAFEDLLDEQLAGGQPKPRRGRPTKEETAAKQEEASVVTKKLVAGAVKMPFELWSIRQKVDGLALTDSEAEQIAEPVRLLIEHYLPQIPPIAYAWGSLAVNVFWIMRSRLLLIAAIKEQNEQLRASAGQKGTDSIPGPGRPIPAGSNKMPTMEQIRNPKT